MKILLDENEYELGELTLNQWDKVKELKPMEKVKNAGNALFKQDDQKVQPVAVTESRLDTDIDTQVERCTVKEMPPVSAKEMWELAEIHGKVSMVYKMPGRGG